MKIKTAVHALCAISAISLCGYGAYTLYINGEFPLAMSSQTTSVSKKQVQSPTKPTVSSEPTQVKHPPKEFKAPELPSDMAFIHMNYIPTDIDSIDYEPKVSQDDPGRVITIKELHDDQHPIKIGAQWNLVKAATCRVEVNGEHILLPYVTITKGIIPVAKAMQDAIQTNSAPIAIKMTFEYTSDKDIVPEYTHIEVFTTKTKDVAYKVTLHSVDPEGPINYETGEFY